MSASTESLATWSRRQWLQVIGGIVAIQLLLVMVFSQRSLLPARTDESLTTVKLAPELASSRIAYGLGGVPDPTLFALMNRQGFSARTWQDISFLEHSLTDWQEPVRWLAPDATRLGQDFSRNLLAGEVNRPQIDDKPAPQADVPEVVTDIALKRSVVELSPELRGRSLVSAVQLPPQSHSEILTNSIVQVVVNPAGNVLSARLVRGSGWKAADRAALEIASRAQFNRLPPPAGVQGHAWSAMAVTVGDLIFRWHTLPPTATNRISAPPSK